MFQFETSLNFEKEKVFVLKWISLEIRFLRSKFWHCKVTKCIVFKIKPVLKESALLLHLWASVRWKKVTLDSSGPRHRPPHGQDGQTGYPWDHLPPINSVILKQWLKEDEAVLSDTWLCASCVGIGGGSLDLGRPGLDSKQVCPVILCQTVLLFLSKPKQL